MSKSHPTSEKPTDQDNRALRAELQIPQALVEEPPSAVKPGERIHGVKVPRGLYRIPDPGRRTAQPHSRFGRMFPNLPGFVPPEAALTELGRPGGIMADSGSLDNPSIPAGFTSLGQFLDHDITFDPISKLNEAHDPNALENFRTPRFDLDSLYMSGPADTPFIYDQNNTGKLLLGRRHESGWGHDHLRNSQAIAMIGDPRNDENLIVAQLHTVFMKFHNKTIDYLAPVGGQGSTLFPEAQRAVRWHYQWMIVHDFLPRIVGQNVVTDILQNGRKFYEFGHEPFMPVEFAMAAYRFGHSMVRNGYVFNSHFPTASLQDLLDHTRQSVPDNWLLLPDDWKNFFTMKEGSPSPPSRKIDAKLASTLLDLKSPMFGQQGFSLATRNLQRGVSLRLPSGQAIARAMAMTPLTEAELLRGDPDQTLKKLGLVEQTPLWFYLLKEAEVQRDGLQLGDVGGRIVAEVFIGLLEGDPDSYLNAFVRVGPTGNPGQAAPRAAVHQGTPNPSGLRDALQTQPVFEEPVHWPIGFVPFLPSSQPGTFSMADLVRFATSP